MGCCGHAKIFDPRYKQPQQPRQPSGSFFDLGRAARCLLSIGGGRFMHLVVLYGFQGADRDVTQLELTNQLFDAVLGELAVIAPGQPVLIVVPCLSKGISALG